MDDQDEMLRYLKVQKEADEIRRKYGGSGTRADMMHLLHEEMLKKITDLGLSQKSSKESESQKSSTISKPPKAKKPFTKPPSNQLPTEKEVPTFNSEPNPINPGGVNHQ